MEFDIEMVNRLIHHRRSIYPAMYTGEPVDDQVIHQLLKNANMAPTHKLTEPWRFTVFKGSGLRKLAEFQSSLYRKVSMERGDFNEKTYQNLQSKPLKASHVIAIGMKRDEKSRLPEIEEIESVAAAVQNMYLTATAYGIGGYWGSGGITYLEDAKSFFGLGPSDKLLGFFFVGTPSKWPQGRRTPYEEKINWVE